MTNDTDDLHDPTGKWEGKVHSLLERVSAKARTTTRGFSHTKAPRGEAVSIKKAAAPPPLPPAPKPRPSTPTPRTPRDMRMAHGEEQSPKVAEPLPVFVTPASPPPQPPVHSYGGEGAGGKSSRGTWLVRNALLVMLWLVVYWLISLVLEWKRNHSVQATPEEVVTIATESGQSRSLSEVSQPAPSAQLSPVSPPSQTSIPTPVRKVFKQEYAGTLPKLWHIPPRATVKEGEYYDVTRENDGYTLHGTYFKFTQHERGRQFTDVDAVPGVQFLLRHQTMDDACTSGYSQGYAHDKLQSIYDNDKTSGVSLPIGVEVDDDGCKAWFDRMRGQPIEVYVKSGEVTLHFEAQPK